VIVTAVFFLISALTGGLYSTVALGQTAQGEIEDRPSPVARRFCIGGTNGGERCNQNSDCPSSTCTDRNKFTIQTAVHYDAPAGDLTAIQNMITAGSAVIFDITDGQAEITQSIIYNNAFGTTEADLRIYPATCTSGTSMGNACAANNDCPPNTGANPGRCGVWWWASTGAFRNGGAMNVSINNINAVAQPGNLLAHEFVHLVFDARDEYESRPNCGANTGNASCPDPATTAAGETECLMDSNGAELCWGQGDPANLTSITGGNHDATNVTEQSECRSDRSCWDQIGWSWPDTMLVPGGAPDPAANGATVGATNFTVVDDAVRVVLVLDESGSMSAESPTRMERLQVAAGDFIALAENDAEVGIVSYSNDAETSSGRVAVSIAALGANRSTWTNAISGLAPDARTNIGAGLEKAKDMIVAAGGVTANTYVVLMTDGLNNEPGSQATAAADLDSKVDDLLTSNIPVYVTCTGSDLGLDSQCSEIGSGTGGYYVDSADPAQLPEAFVDFHERITGHSAVDSVYGWLSKIQEPKIIYLDAGSDSATFTLQWTDSNATASFTVIDPNGVSYRSQAFPNGRFVKVANPIAGEWKMVIDGGSADSKFVGRAYTRHPTSIMNASIRQPTVRPGEDMYVFAFPRNLGRPITLESGVITARVTLPDGSTDTLELLDRGRNPSGGGDDMPGDGIFTGVYSNTAQKGAYQFLISGDMEKWRLSHDAHEYQFDESQTARFVREVRLSAAVADPNDVETTPEDDKRPDTPEPTDPHEELERLLIIVIILVIILILITLWCCSRRNKRQQDPIG
jgi:hypothetical protein